MLHGNAKLHTSKVRQEVNWHWTFTRLEISSTRVPVDVWTVSVAVAPLHARVQIVNGFDASRQSSRT